MRDVIVEVRGGVVVEIYNDDPETRLIVVDWDRIDDEESKVGFEWNPGKLATMPADTFAQYREGANVSNADDCIVTQVNIM